MPRLLPTVVLRYTNYYDKDTSNIAVSEDLTIPVTYGRVIQYYSLSGFIQHDSESMEEGHYVAIIATKA